MGNEANESRAQQILEKADQVELQFNDLFTGLTMMSFHLHCNEIQFLFSSLPAVVDEENLNEAYHRTLDVIDREQAKAFVWIPSKENI